MKMKFPLMAALVIGLPMASSAFTLDPVGYEGSELSPDPLSISVPGYGELIFEAAVGTVLVVSSAYENDNESGGPSLSFDQNEAVKITFNGLPPLNAGFDFTGVSTGEGFAEQNPQAFLITPQGGGDGAALDAVGWNAIPEPTLAMPGLLGTAVFAFRRRR
jgi:hypothetical protein